MSDTHLLTIVGVALAILVPLIFLNVSLTRLRQGLPDRQLIQQLGGHSQALGQALESQRQSLEAFPGEVSGKIATEVRDGLAPLRREFHDLSQRSSQALNEVSGGLNRNHEHLTRAVLTLNQEGSLDEWLGNLREAVAPLKSASSAVEGHYQTSGRLLESTAELITQWSDQRAAVVEAFQRFSQLVERATASEATHLRDIEHRLMSRLAEVAETNATVAHALSELQTASRHTLESQENLATNVQETVLKVGEVADLGRQTQTLHQELIRAQQELQQRSRQWQVDADQALGILLQRIGEIAAGVESLTGKVARTTDQTISGIRQLLAELQAQQAGSLGQLQQLQERASQQQKELLEAQRSHHALLQQTVPQLPSRSLQLATLGVLVGQLLVLGVLTFQWLQNS